MYDKDEDRRARLESVRETIQLSEDTIARSRAIIEKTKRAVSDSRERAARSRPEE